MKFLGVSQQLWNCSRMSQGGDCVVDAFIHDSSHLLLPDIFIPVLFPFLYLCNYVSLLKMGVIEETTNHLLPFYFHPIKAPLWSPSIPSRKRCLRHYSKLPAAITLNSDQRPRGVRLDWISISKVHRFLFTPIFFPIPRPLLIWNNTGMSLLPSLLCPPACLPGAAIS